MSLLRLVAALTISLCHVTINESTDKLKAKAIECDEGRYFEPK